MWAIGRYDLGLGEADVWGSTPRLLALLLERRRLAERRQDLRFGLLASVVVNGIGGQSTTPGDFFPEGPVEGQADEDQLPEEAVLAIAQHMIRNHRQEQTNEPRTAAAEE